MKVDGRMAQDWLAVLKENGFLLKKGLGQNFLVNPEIAPKIARAVAEGVHTPFTALEIGPGAGVLTRELSGVAANVLAVELDSGLAPVLERTLSGCGNVRVIYEDILKTNLTALLSASALPVHVCANLPYYITSPVLLRLLEQKPPFSRITVMVQREVAQRLCAKPGTREASSVTLFVQYHAETELLFRVRPGSFYPAPRVESAVLRLTPRKAPVVPKDEAKLFLLIRAAFAQRRKTLSNALCAGLAMDRRTVDTALVNAGISPAARAETCTLENFCRLEHCLAAQE
jgi:16S rRNA (adenine1518-N6/adenine1519-N6)-dimethyltransferase